MRNHYEYPVKEKNNGVLAKTQMEEVRNNEKEKRNKSRILAQLKSYTCFIAASLKSTLLCAEVLPSWQ